MADNTEDQASTSTESTEASTSTTAESGTETATTSNGLPADANPNADVQAVQTSDSTATTAEDQQQPAAEEPAEPEPEPEPPTWYTYKKGDHGLNVYSGAVQADEQPENSTNWAPPTLSQTVAAYWDGQGWLIGLDFDQMSIESLISVSLKQATSDFANEVATLRDGYPAEEQSSWAQQVSESQALQADSNAPAPMMRALAEARSRDLMDLAKEVLTKADAYSTAYIKALATYQALKDKIQVAKSITDLPPLTYDSVHMV